jgi:hypothetical protein
MLLALFGFMDVLIVMKWLFPYQPIEVTKAEYYTDQAPSIIHTMIAMFLDRGQTK